VGLGAFFAEKVFSKSLKSGTFLGN
jgi:hypothetical protein